MGSMISLGINLVVVIIFGFFAHAQYTWHMLLVPLNIIQLYLLALGCALLTSTLYVYFHDVAHIWEVVLQAMFYSIPIIYPITMVSNSYPVIAKIMLLNPVAQVIMDIRHNLVAPDYVPTTWTMISNPLIVSIPYICTFVLLIAGIAVFRKYSRKFAEVM